MKIYTKKGDRGETGLPGNRRVAKTDPLFETLGYFDQTSGFIGLAVSLLPQTDESLVRQLEGVQSTFLDLGACLASPQPSTATILTQLPELVSELEVQIDKWDELLPPLRNFILAGGTSAAAALHLARVSARTAERNYHRLPMAQKPAAISQYLNRLSDYLFQAARFANHQAGQLDKVWKAR